MNSWAKMAVALLLLGPLAGCGLGVPAKTFESETPSEDFPHPSPEGLYENKIVSHLVCEVAQGLYAAESKIPLPWLVSKKWGTAITLTITAEDQTGVSPGLSFLKPFQNHIFTFPVGGNVTGSQSFTLGVGASISSNATRTETIQFTLVNSDLFQQGKANPTCERYEGGIMVDGDLKIREFIYDKAVIALYDNANDYVGKNSGIAYQYPFYNTFTETINFVAILSGNVNPSWKLAQFSDNASGASLFNAQRTYTNQAIITIGPLGTKPSETEAAALGASGQNQHQAQVQAGANATAMHGQMGF
jgi:hypothetical protein